MDFSAECLILLSLEAPDAKQLRMGIQGNPGGILHAWFKPKRRILGMTKSLEVLSEAVQHPKHPFSKVDNQPKKKQKHRYERRKIRECLQLGEWMGGES